MQFFIQNLEEHNQVLSALRETEIEKLQGICDACVKCLKSGGKILLFGNGGSAADAQHLAAELVVRMKHHRKALPAMACTTDTSVLTALGNDYGFDKIFSRQIEAFGNPEDLAWGFSTSGNSRNILEAMKAAKFAGMATIGFSGRGGGAMSELTVQQKTTFQTSGISSEHI